ncbi:MAG: tetratricopeptide repeat protein [Bacteroidetes bacterium]|nr:tetratricopeptide repeat protein [Bacteroidota bacterium]
MFNILISKNFAWTCFRLERVRTTTKNIIVYALFLCISCNNVNGQSSSLSEEYLRLADDFKKSMKQDSAIKYYEKAAVEFQALGNVEKFVYSYNHIGIILTRQDNYEKSKFYLEKALSIGLSSLDSNNLVIATTYISLGVNYNAEENYSRSLFYHNKALAIRLLKLGEYHADVATSYGNIGNVYFNSKDYEKAIDAHLKAMEIREKLLVTLA